MVATRILSKKKLAFVLGMYIYSVAYFTLYVDYGYWDVSLWVVGHWEGCL